MRNVGVDRNQLRQQCQVCQLVSVTVLAAAARSPLLPRESSCARLQVTSKAG